MSKTVASGFAEQINLLNDIIRVVNPENLRKDFKIQSQNSLVSSFPFRNKILAMAVKD